MNEKIVRIAFDKIVGFAGGQNTRKATPHLHDKFAIFRSEMGEGDPREVLSEFVVGKNATTETRTKFVKLIKENEPDLFSLSQSILAIDQLDPCLLVASPDGYVLAAGGRRFLAAMVANIIGTGAFEHLDDKVKAIIVVGDDERCHTISVSTNLHRAQMTPVEEGLIYHNLHEKAGWSDKKIAESLHLVMNNGKPNVQRVGQYRRLHSDKVSDADRAKLESGEAVMSKILEKSRHTSSGGGSTAPAEGRERALPYKTGVKFNDRRIARKVLAATNIENAEDAFLFAVKMMLQKVEIPEGVLPTPKPRTKSE